MKQVTFLMIALVLSTGCSVIIELPYAAFTFPEEYPMTPQTRTQDVALMDDAERDAVFHEEICRNVRANAEPPTYDLETTLHCVEMWIAAQVASRRIWSLKIVREVGGAYLVHLHNNELGERISHSHELHRSLKMTTILANRTSRQHPVWHITCNEPGCTVVITDPSRQKVYCKDHACPSCFGTGLAGGSHERESCHACEMSGRLKGSIHDTAEAE